MKLGRSSTTLFICLLISFTFIGCSSNKNSELKNELSNSLNGSTDPDTIDSKFKNELSNSLNSFTDPDINENNKKLFNDLYGFKKAKNQGLEYCKTLSSGVSKEEAKTKRLETTTDLIYQNKITPQEAASLTVIDTSIELAAQEVYCPEHKDIGQIPIKERLK